MIQTRAFLFPVIFLLVILTAGLTLLGGSKDHYLADNPERTNLALRRTATTSSGGKRFYHDDSSCKTNRQSDLYPHTGYRI
ncbi:MAG: hypothetical protein R3C61_16975 [Bacteroidia bacterium]